MNCNKCGAPVGAGEQFCGTCGSPVSSQKATNDAPTLNYSAATTPIYDVTENTDRTDIVDEAELFSEDEEFVEKESVFQPLVNDRPLVMTGDSNQRSGGGSGKFLTFAIIIVVFLALIGGIGFAFFPQIQRMVMGEQDYYLYKEKEFFAKMSDSLDTTLDNKDASPYNVKGDISMSMTGEDFPAEVATLFKNLSYAYNANVDQSTKSISGEVDVGYEGKSAMKISMKQVGDRMSMMFPGVSEGEYVTGGENLWLQNLINGDNGEYLAMTGKSKADFDAILERYYNKVIVDAFPKDKIVKGKDVYGDTKCSTVEFVFDNETKKALLQALVTELEADKDQNIEMLSLMLTYIEIKGESLTSMAGMEMSLTKDEIATKYGEFIDSLKSEIEFIPSTSDKISYKVYYGNRGDIISRQAIIGEGKIIASTYEKDGKSITEFIVKGPDVDVSFVDSHSEKGGLYTGAITVKGIDETGKEFVINYSLDTKNVSQGVPLPLLSADFAFDEVSFALKSASTATGADYNITTTVPNGSINIKFTANISKIDSFTVDIPEKSTITDEQYSEIMQELTNKLIETMGLGGMMGGMTDPDHTDDYDEHSTPEIDKKMYEDMYGELLNYDFEANPEDFTAEDLELLKLIIDEYNKLEA